MIRAAAAASRRLRRRPLRWGRYLPIADFPSVIAHARVLAHLPVAVRAAASGAVAGLRAAIDHDGCLVLAAILAVALVCVVRLGVAVVAVVRIVPAGVAAVRIALQGIVLRTLRHQLVLIVHVAADLVA